MMYSQSAFDKKDNDKQDISVPHYWLFVGEIHHPLMNGRLPSEMASNVENITYYDVIMVAWWMKLTQWSLAMLVYISELGHYWSR